MPASDAEFAHVEEAVRAAGFDPFFRRDWEEGPRLDCNASGSLARFWLARFNGVWVIGLYSGYEYEILDAENVASTVVALLQKTSFTPWRLPPEIQASVGVKERPL